MLFFIFNLCLNNLIFGQTSHSIYLFIYALGLFINAKYYAGSNMRETDFAREGLKILNEDTYLQLVRKYFFFSSFRRELKTIRLLNHLSTSLVMLEKKSPEKKMLAFIGVVFIKNYLSNFVKKDAIHGVLHFSKKHLSIKTSDGNS